MDPGHTLEPGQFQQTSAILHLGNQSPACTGAGRFEIHECRSYLDIFGERSDGADGFNFRLIDMSVGKMIKQIFESIYT
jgi:hypothetical protein